MLRLKNISLIQFKNYAAGTFDLTERIIGICGKNGIGKTNLLDAIYYLCFTKGYFTRLDQVNVMHNRVGFRISGEFENMGRSVQAVCILRETGKKEFLLDGEPYEKFSDHIGKFPAVMIAPDDSIIITGASDERRRFLDSLLSQLNHEYLEKLIVYNRVLLQRNTQLKSFAETRSIDQSLLEVLDRQLIEPGTYVHSARRRYLNELLPSIQGFYKQISGENYHVEIEYESQLSKVSFEEILHLNHQKDAIAQRTTAGPHRDDILFALDGIPFKNVASQGQRKSLLFALKLAEFTALKDHKGFPPILMLDDVFEKLDETRVNNLLQFVCCENAGQIFFTDTHCNRLSTALEQMKKDFQIVSL